MMKKYKTKLFTVAAAVLLFGQIGIPIVNAEPVLDAGDSATSEGFHTLEQLEPNVIEHLTENNNYTGEMGSGFGGGNELESETEAETTENSESEEQTPVRPELRSGEVAPGIVVKTKWAGLPIEYDVDSRTLTLKEGTFNTRGNLIDIAGSDMTRLIQKTIRETPGGENFKWEEIKGPSYTINMTIKKVVFDGTVHVNNIAQSMFSMLGGVEEFVNMGKYLDLSKCRNMGGMFDHDISLDTDKFNAEIKNLDVSEVNNFVGTFSNLKITRLDLSSWSSPNIKFMSTFVSGNDQLEELNLSDQFKINASAIYSNMFGYGMYEPRDSAKTRVKILHLGSGIVNLNQTEANGKNNAGLVPISEMPGFDPNVYTGKWVNVGDGTIEDPKGTNIWTSEELMMNYRGSTTADTYVWQKRKALAKLEFSTDKPEYKTGERIKSFLRVKKLDTTRRIYKFTVTGFDKLTLNGAQELDPFINDGVKVADTKVFVRVMHRDSPSSPYYAAHSYYNLVKFDPKNGNFIVLPSTSGGLLSGDDYLELELDGTALRPTKGTPDADVAFKLNYSDVDNIAGEDGNYTTSTTGVINIVDSIIKIQEVPESLMFETKALTTDLNGTEIKRVDPANPTNGIGMNIKVADNRYVTPGSVAQNWNLNVTATDFENSNNNTVPGLQLIYRSGNSVTPINSTDAVMIEHHDYTTNPLPSDELVNLSWAPEDGINVRVTDRSQLNTNTTYTSTITFELVTPV